MLKLIQDDPWLAPYEAAIQGRHDYVCRRLRELAPDGSLSDFADGYMYFGLQFSEGRWIFREWAPNATAIHLLCDTNRWQQTDAYALRPVGNGVWEVSLPAEALHHNEHYKLLVEWNGGRGERIPAWARRVVQDTGTKMFCAQVWQPDVPYVFQHRDFRPKKNPLLIYECHIGMAVEEQRVGTYEEFRRNVLPRVAADGYNAIQIMAIQEHPYYGSFGYHVSNFFAPSSRFGTPEELKHLIDDAHGLGIAVIMDIVHSHAVKNTLEGLGLFAGDPGQYFYSDSRREHPAWDSLCFNYESNDVVHFLLSNCKYWLEEFQFDGFRFDGVTSMIYWSHGLGESINSYDDYFNANQNGDALCYLTLANLLIHEVRPSAITIAEEVSSLPGLAAPFGDGGVGFDYRMAMGIPDYWIKTIKEKADEDWKPGAILWELTNHRAEEHTISYAESHDQALVGDKTIIFRLIDAEMYWHMRRDDANLTVDRGMALHKIIRLLTAATINGGYLNFMGNEFGHPEWIDFPREGNGWSHQYARRQWSLADNPELKYQYLLRFDKCLMHLLGNTPDFQQKMLLTRCVNDGDQVLAFQRDRLLFVVNLNPSRSFTDYGMLVDKGSYRMVLNTDSPGFGGFGLIDELQMHLTVPAQPDSESSLPDSESSLPGGRKKARRKPAKPQAANPELEWLRLYLPARSAQVFERIS